MSRLSLMFFLRLQLFSQLLKLCTELSCRKSNIIRNATGHANLLRGTPYNGLYGEAPPERGTFFRLQVYKRVGKSFIINKNISNRRTLWLYQFIHKALHENDNKTSFVSDVIRQSYRWVYERRAFQ